MKTLTRPVVVSIFLIATSSLVIGFSTGPLDVKTGGPGEGLCTECHTGNPLNAPGGSLSITTSSPGYTPGDTIDCVIHLARQFQFKWGFELTVLDSNHQRLGTILDTSNYTQLSTNANGRQYLKHTLSGTFPGVPNASPGWGFRWVSSRHDSGPAYFYIAGNAADNSLSNDGDYIYTSSLTLSYTPPLTCCLGATGNVDCSVSEGVDIGDITVMVDYLFVSFTPLCCMAEGDVDGDNDINIGDLTLLVDNCFISFAPLIPCQ